MNFADTSFAEAPNAQRGALTPPNVAAAICSCRRHASQHGWLNVLELARDRVERFFNEDDEVFVRAIGGEIARGGNFPVVVARSIRMRPQRPNSTDPASRTPQRVTDCPDTLGRGPLEPARLRYG